MKIGFLRNVINGLIWWNNRKAFCARAVICKDECQPCTANKCSCTQTHELLHPTHNTLQASFRETKLINESLPLFVRGQKNTSRTPVKNFFLFSSNPAFSNYIMGSGCRHAHKFIIRLVISLYFSLSGCVRISLTSKAILKHGVFLTGPLPRQPFCFFRMALQAAREAEQQHLLHWPDCDNQMHHWNHWHIRKSTAQSLAPQLV